MSKRIRSRVIFRTSYFEVLAKSPEGDAGEPYYAIRTADYVGMVALTRRRQLVLVRQFRPPVEAEVLELPSGHLEPGESAEECAVRELYEETGFRARAVEHLGCLKTDSGRLTNRIHVCFSDDLEEPERVEQREPGVEPVVCDLDEFERRFAAGEFDHALHLGAVYLAVSLGKLPPLRIGSFAGGC